MSARRLSSSTNRRQHSAGSLHNQLHFKLANPPSPTESTASHVKHFVIGLIVLGLGALACVHILLSMGVSYRSTFFHTPRTQHYTEAELGLPTCCRPHMQHGRDATSSLQRLPAAYTSGELATKGGESIIRPTRYFLDADHHSRNNNHNNNHNNNNNNHNHNNQTCAAAVDAGVCISGVTMSHTPGLRGVDDSPLRCLPSFVIAGTMKSGTGVLMRWLNIHPHVQSGRGEDGSNEIHFFQDTPMHSSMSTPSGTSSRGGGGVGRWNPFGACGARAGGWCGHGQPAGRAASARGPVFYR